MVTEFSSLVTVLLAEVVRWLPSPLDVARLDWCGNQSKITAISNQVPAKRRIANHNRNRTAEIRRYLDARTSSRRGLTPPGVTHRDLLGGKTNTGGSGKYCSAFGLATEYPDLTGRFRVSEWRPDTTLSWGTCGTTPAVTVVPAPRVDPDSRHLPPP